MLKVEPIGVWISWKQSLLQVEPDRGKAGHVRVGGGACWRLRYGVGTKYHKETCDTFKSTHLTSHRLLKDIQPP